MKHIVFVDFDGVLTTARVHFSQPKTAYQTWSQFDPIAINFFNKIHDNYEDVSFVWTTSWRNQIETCDNLEHILYSMWYNAGFTGFFGKPWRVNADNDLEMFEHREKEIDDYLTNYAPDNKGFIIFDDNDYGYDDVFGKNHFIHTDPQNGITFENMRQAWNVVSRWDPK